MPTGLAKSPEAKAAELLTRRSSNPQRFTTVKSFLSYYCCGLFFFLVLLNGWEEGVGAFCSSLRILGLQEDQRKLYIFFKLNPSWFGLFRLGTWTFIQALSSGMFQIKINHVTGLRKVTSNRSIMISFALCITESNYIQEFLLV